MRILISVCVIVLSLCSSLAIAMPPHPDLVQKIQKGQVPEPIFMSDPGYKARMGIDQGLPEPLLAPGAALVNANFLAICVGFSDQAGTMPPVYFDSLIFGVNPGLWGPTLRDFYNRASYGNFTIVTVNYPSTMNWGVAPNNRYYYSGQGGTYSYGMGTYPNNSQGLCEWAVGAIDPMINFSNYDNNGDGYVDGIIIVHSGRGAEISGDTLDIWSHAWSITPQLRDGVYISTYCIVPEYWNTPGDLTIGVCCHEFGHVLGLPDLYDYGYDSYGLGNWSLMAYGGWNGNGWGFSPAFLDAWSRIFLGFVTPVNVTADIFTATIPAVEDSAKVYRLWTTGSVGPEYYLVEYRYPTFTDTALAFPGVCIYHIDDNQLNNNWQWWPGQPPASHYMVALEQADNAFDLEHYNNAMDTGDPYPGAMGNGVFNDNSAPSARDYYANPTQVSVSSLAFPYPGMATAYLGVGVTGGAPGAPVLQFPLNGSASPLDMQNFVWVSDPLATYYHIQIDNDLDFSSPIHNDSMLAYNYVNFSFTPYPDGIYYWRVRGRGPGGTGPWSDIWSVFIDRQLPYGTIASSPDTAHSSSFTVSWTTGYDPPPSSGIVAYSVLCDSGAGPAWYWQFNVPGNSATFTGARNGNTYIFCAMAHDRAGNQELWNWQFECTTYVEITGPVCTYVVGDANGNGTFNGLDVTYSVAYFKGGPPPPFECECTPGNTWYVAGDVNQSCSFNGLDVTYMVAYLKGGPAPRPCPSCPPAR